MGYLRSHDVTFEPIDQWPGKETRMPRRATFKTAWSSTLGLLDRELSHLGAKRILLRCYLDRSRIRQDGCMRADARPSKPGVILSFDSKQGPISLPCDTFDAWQDNVRAIALSLEALRKMDRYGVSKSGEQYRGWKALPKPPAEAPATIHEAIGWLCSIVTVTDQETAALRRGDKATLTDVIRRAQLLTHPDRGGDPEDFKRVVRYEKLLTA